MRNRFTYFIRLFFSPGLKKYKMGSSLSEQDTGNLQKVNKYLSFLLFISKSIKDHLFSFLGFSFLCAVAGKLAGMVYYRFKAIYILTRARLKKGKKGKTIGR